jgi:hypothetical protein
MDGNQPVADDASQLTEIPNIREFVARSMHAKRLGSGLQGVVYEFDEEAIRHYPILENFLVKRFRPLADWIGGNAEDFKRKLPKSKELLELPDELGGRNFGQPVFKDEHGNFAILLKQKGEDLNKWVRKHVCDGQNLSTAQRYEQYLEWLRQVPDEAFIDLADKIAFVKSRGFDLDHTKKDNLFWDKHAARFNLIDLFPKIVDLGEEHKDPLRKRDVFQRPLQIAYANAFGVRDGVIHERDIPLSQEMKALFKDTNKRIIMSFEPLKGEAMPFAKDAGIKALETLIEDRIDALKLDERFKDKYPPIGRTHMPASGMLRSQLDASSVALQGKLGEVHGRTVQT